MFNKKLIIITSLLAILLSWGCTKENLNDCPKGVSLLFSYRFDGPELSTLNSRVALIRLYVFDDNNVLQEIKPITTSSLVKGKIRLDIEPGDYTFIALGFSGGDMLGGGYQDAQITDPALGTFNTPAVVGATTLDNFRVMLKSAESTESPGLWSPLVTNFDNLYTAVVGSVTIIESPQEQIVSMSMINNCSILDITVEGIDIVTPQSAVPINIFFQGEQGSYRYNGQIDDSAPSLRFAPPYKSLTSQVMTMDIRTLRMDRSYYLQNPIYLHVVNSTTLSDVIAPLNVVDIISDLKDSSGNLLYQTQDDIDRAERFVIKIYLSLDLGVSITVNGFVVEGLDPILM